MTECSNREDRRGGFTFFPADWLAAEDVRLVSYAARGLWIDMLCIMARASKCGMLVEPNGSKCSSKTLANLRGGTEAEVDGLLAELEAKGVFSREEGAIICRRMRAPGLLKEKRAEAGRLGGLAKAKQGIKQNLAPVGKERKGRERKGKEKAVTDVVDNDFEAFWKAYPRKVGKKAAKAAWGKATDKPPLATILLAVETQKKWPEWTKDHGQYIPHPTTWLNQGRWSDEGSLFDEKGDKYAGGF